MARYREKGSDGRAGLAPWQVDRAVRLLLGDSAQDNSVEQLAAQCGLSRSHFGRAFKASMGLPPHRWLTHFRIARAQEMLAGRASIAEIALNCGFADQSHLTRVFNAITGCSPAAWRRQRRAGLLTQPGPNDRIVRDGSPGALQNGDAHVDD